MNLSVYLHNLLLLRLLISTTFCETARSFQQTSITLSVDFSNMLLIRPKVATYLFLIRIMISTVIINSAAGLNKVR